MEQDSRVALFVDLENFVGSCRNLGLPYDLEPLLEHLKGHGRLQYRRSFGDLTACVPSVPEQRRVRLMLADTMVQHEDIPYQSRYKNSADIRLAVEAISTAYSMPEINTFAIIASDRDYVPLFNKLRELGREIIGIAASSESVSLAYRNACDVIYYQEPLLQRRGPRHEPDQRIEISESVLLLLLRAVQLVEQVGRKPVGTAVSQTMRQLQPDFSPTQYGSFGALCREAEERQWLRLDTHGMDLLLELTDAGGQRLSEARPGGYEPNSVQPGSMAMLYERWVKEKLRISIPDETLRAQIFSALADVLEEHGQSDAGGISLRDLSQRITNMLTPAAESAQCFKLLYGLYRNRAFHCGEGLDAYNPIIYELACAADKLDSCFLENVLHVYQREQPGSQPDVAGWAKVWFSDEEQGVKVISDLFADE